MNKKLKGRTSKSEISQDKYTEMIPTLISRAKYKLLMWFRHGLEWLLIKVKYARS